MKEIGMPFREISLAMIAILVGAILLFAGNVNAVYGMAPAETAAKAIKVNGTIVKGSIGGKEVDIDLTNYIQNEERYEYKTVKGDVFKVKLKKGNDYCINTNTPKRFSVILADTQGTVVQDPITGGLSAPYYSYYHAKKSGYYYIIVRAKKAYTGKYALSVKTGKANVKVTIHLPAGLTGFPCFLLKGKYASVLENKAWTSPYYIDGKKISKKKFWKNADNTIYNEKWRKRHSFGATIVFSRVPKGNYKLVYGSFNAIEKGKGKTLVKRVKVKK